MTDIVERLRPEAATFVELKNAVNTMREAADEIERLRNDMRKNACGSQAMQGIIERQSAEIERLRADNERLRAALKVIARGYIDEGGNRRDLENSWVVARWALEGKDG